MSLWAVASQVPSGATAKAVTVAASLPVRVARGCPVAVSQVRTVPSRLAVARQVPLAAAARAVTRLLCPLWVPRGCPEAVSQICTVPPLSLAMANQAASGATATAARTAWYLIVRRRPGCEVSGDGQAGVRATWARVAWMAWAWGAQYSSWLTRLQRISVSEYAGSVGARTCAFWARIRARRPASGVPARARSA